MTERFLKFGLVGGAGFIVDAGTLAFLLKTTPLDVFSARLIAIGLALLATWLLNRTITFGTSGHSLGAEVLRYGGVGIAGAVINYAIYAGLLLSMPQVGAFGALCLASAAVMFLSYFGYSKFVFSAK